jgi:hypothetical protein
VTVFESEQRSIRKYRNISILTEEGVREIVREEINRMILEHGDLMKNKWELDKTYAGL